MEPLWDESKCEEPWGGRADVGFCGGDKIDGLLEMFLGHCGDLG
jgi:hypothetical protein